MTGAAGTEREALAAWLRDTVAGLTDRDADGVGSAATFVELGLDSVRLVRLAAAVSDRLGRDVDPAELYEHHTIDLLAAHLTGGAGRRPVAARASAPGTGEPVAVVGMACRFPGADDLDAFWRLLCDGTDAVGPVPAERASAALGSAGLIGDITGFDAAFFGIGADEAARMDPQQRLLLETGWDAVEDSGTAPAELRGTATGVFVGLSGVDYAHRSYADPDGASATSATGSSGAVAANRLSYLFDLRGPSLAVDTACSSSLVAVHLALRALRAGECDRAVAAGVNVLIEDAPSAGLHRAGMLAPGGRCRPFGADADGYVRGEGCGVVVLRPLRDALAAGDRVYAVLRGSAVGSDGASNGLTAPNPAAQRTVLGAALADARTEPGAVGYVECHGTGTPLGDPIEARALAEVRGGAPGLIGSVKSNIGHLEAAAGIAGLIKTVLAVRHGRIPASLHAADPNPAIPFAEHGLEVVHHTRDWPDGERVAGVSGFGFGGTNVHVVLGAGPPGEPPPDPDGPTVVALGARSAAGMARWCTAAADAVDREPGRAAELARTLTLHRTAHRPHRVAVVSETPGGLAAALRDAARDVGRPVPPAAPPVVFVFSGQGSQFAGMGHRMLAEDPLFDSVIRRCDEAVAGLLGWSVRDVLTGDAADRVDVADTDVAQVLVTAVQLGLVAVLRARGVVPAAVVGHSVGEIAAAVAAGGLDPAGAMRLAVSRGRAVAARTASDGGMLAVDLPAAEALRGPGAGLEVAAVNSPGTVVLGGTADRIRTAAREFTARGVTATVLPVRYAFHTAAVEGAARALAADPDLPEARPAPGRWWSTVPGTAEDGARDAAYWARGVREPVRFADAVEAAIGAGAGVLVEVGPRPVLQASLHRTAAGRVAVAGVFADAGRSGFLRGTAALWSLGIEVNWVPAVGAGPPGRAPGYPFDRLRHWIDEPPSSRPRTDSALLGTPIDLADPGPRRIWQRGLSPSARLLTDHVVVGRPLLAGTALMEIALQAGAELTGATPGEHGLAGVELHAPLPGDAPRLVQTALDREPSGPGGHAVTVYSRPARAAEWTRHLSARVLPPGAGSGAATTSTGEDPDREQGADRVLSADVLYTELSGRGLSYGPAFRLVRSVRVDGSGRHARVEFGDDPLGSEPLRPRLLDAALHAVAGLRPGPVGAAGPGAAIPVGLDRLTWSGSAGAVLGAEVTARPAGPGSLLVDAVLTGADGVPVGRIEGLRLVAPVSGAPPVPARPERDDAVRHYRAVWREVDGGPGGDPGRQEGWLIVPVPGRAAEAFADRLSDAGAGVVWNPVGPPPGPRTGVLVVTGPEGGTDPGSAVRAALAALRPLVLGRLGPAARLVVVTHGAQEAAGSRVVDPGAAALWGLLRTVAVEQPSVPVTCLDLDPDDPDPAGSLLRRVGTGGPELEQAVRRDRMHVRRVVAVARPEPAPFQVDPAGGYLVTGGSGALGRQVVARLLAGGARTVVVLSRSASGRDRPDPRVIAVDGDAADPADVRRALAALGGTVLRGVVHAAGVLANGPLLELTDDAVERVVGAKARGALVLDRALGAVEDDLHFVVSFSSAAGVLGSPGQANYAAANAVLDAVAEARRARGTAAVSVQWGPWAEEGMAADGAAARTLRTAASALEPAAALDVLGSVAAGPDPTRMVLPFDLADLARFYPSESGRSLLAEVADGDDELRTVGARSARPSLAVPYTAPRDEMEERIAHLWQRALDVVPVGVHDVFFELGGDSVTANQILVELQRTTGVAVPPGRAFADFTVAALAGAVHEQLVADVEELSEEEARELLRRG